ncbi:uncharacterized protein [Littorina saxatilis]|uniref:uncharacterized protein isoform X2 n=1 Tax=Littorina saxatilis TaxID=31220 RepID=UPI0038B43BC9
MLLQVVLFVLFVPCVAAVCTFPSQLQGQWGSKFDGWTDLTITSGQITGMQPDGRSLDYSCYQSNGTTYVIVSAEFSFGNIQFHFYTCLDIVPSQASDVLYFRVLTHPNIGHQNFSVMSYAQDGDRNISEICKESSTEVPLHFDVFLKKGFENNIETDRCPRSLHAEFTANFTNDVDFSKCPEGFVIDGCNNRSHLTFNYSDCSGDQSSNGAPMYMCLTSMEAENTTYTTIYLPSAEGAPVNAYEIACMEQTMVDGQLSITKSGGACGAMPSVEMMANETVSCRMEVPETTTTVNDGNAASAIVYGCTTLLIAVVCGVLASALP